MQIKDIYLNHKQFLNAIIKVAITIIVVIFIFDQFDASWDEISINQWPQNIFLYLLILSGLMLVNWTLEAMRWKKSIEVFEPLTISASLQVILSGLALNWILPFTTGDAIVRLANGMDTIKTASALLLNRAIMMGITLVYGLVSIWRFSSFHLRLNTAYLIGLTLIGLIAYIMYRNRAQYFKYFSQMTRRDTMVVLSISLIRYLVFVFQLYLAIKIFIPALSDEIIVLGIGWIFFFRSVIPSFLGGIGVREASGIVFFSTYLVDTNLVILPIFIVWVINNAIPSLVGLALLIFQPNLSLIHWKKNKFKEMIS